jgi:hypothetical protein
LREAGKIEDTRSRLRNPRLAFVPVSVSVAAESSLKVAVVTFGLFGDQSVFESAAKGGSGERMGEAVASSLSDLADHMTHRV